MKTIIISLLLIIFSFSRSEAQTDITDSFPHNGLIRSYILHLPPSYNSIDHFPVVVVLHGGGSGNGEDLLLNHHFDEVGDTANYISLFPNGYYNDWADGRGVSQADTAGIDDVSFLNSLVEHLSEKFTIDTSRMYICGVSNGGMLVQKLACESPYKFSAFASIIASMPDSIVHHCNPDQSVPIILMNGTSDAWVPYSGGPLGPITNGGSVIGTDSTISIWQSLNSCIQTFPDSLNLTDIVFTDNCDVTRFNYGICTDSSEIILYRINNGGHTIPGMESPVNPIPFFGYINYDIDAAIEIWKFFRKHSKTRNITLISENITNLNFRVYPNPTSGIAYLIIPNLTDFEISVFNSIGQKVTDVNKDGYLNLSNKSNGIYYVMIIVKNQKTTGQFVIKY
ncbi:MAG: T9SS type A sorting domain-containing protein [Bacteroidales bacterium]|nr:T9SS type A sorting domain-containing protein [Bacteroidales bacterium]